MLPKHFLESARYEIALRTALQFAPLFSDPFLILLNVLFALGNLFSLHRGLTYSSSASGVGRDLVARVCEEAVRSRLRGPLRLRNQGGPHSPPAHQAQRATQDALREGQLPECRNCSTLVDMADQRPGTPRRDDVYDEWPGSLDNAAGRALETPQPESQKLALYQAVGSRPSE